MAGQELGSERAAIAAENLVRHIEISMGNPFAPEIRRNIHSQLRGMMQFFYLRDDKTVGHTNIEAIIKANKEHQRMQACEKRKQQN